MLAVSLKHFLRKLKQIHGYLCNSNSARNDNSFQWRAFASDGVSHTPGNLRAMVQAKLRNIKTGSSFAHRFRSSDTVDRATLEQHEIEFMYSDGSHHHFMNTETYEQVALSGEE